MAGKCQDDFTFLRKVEKTFGRPLWMLDRRDMSFTHKKKLLRLWHDERAKLMLTCFHGRDYTNDNKLRELSEALKITEIMDNTMDEA